MSNRTELIQKVRDGWPAAGTGYYEVRGAHTIVPPVRDGGLTARFVEHAVDTVLAAKADDAAVERGARVLIEDGRFGVPWEDASDEDRAETVGRVRTILEAVTEASK